MLSEILKDLELRKAAGAEARTNQAQEKDADSCDTQPSNDAPPASDPSGVPKASEVSDGDASKAGGDTRPKGNLHPVKGRAAPVPRFGPGFGTTLNPQAPFCRQDRTDGPANQDPAGHNGHRQASWLHKLLSRYHRNMRDPDVKQSKGIRAQDAAGGHFEAGPDAAKGSASQQGAHGAGKAPGTPGAHGIHGARGVRGVHGAHGCTEQMGRMECTEGMEFMEHARHKVRQGRLAHPHWRRDPSPRHLPCRPLSPGEQYQAPTGKRSCCRLSGRAMRNDLLSRGCLSGAEAGNPAPP